MAASGPIHVVIGAGATGRGVVERLHGAGRPVRVLTRSGRATFDPGVEHVACDVVRPDACAEACAGAAVVYGCPGLEDYRDWPERWPPMMAGMLAGAERAGAPFVFMDNLYMYGAVDGPLHEDLPLTDRGVKPAVRSRLTRMWREAHRAGRVRAVAVRASDFYGPGVTKALLGDFVIGRALDGKPSQVIGNPDCEHAFAYMPDVVRALVEIGDAAIAEVRGDGRAVCGEAWHVPHAPARPVREIVDRVHRHVGRPTKMQVAGPWTVRLLGLFGGNMRELSELMFQWTKPYRVDDTKFRERFGWSATSMDVGLPRTIDWYRRRARATAAAR